VRDEAMDTAQGRFKAYDTEKEEFVDFTKKLIGLMIDFSLLALRAISKKKQASLTDSQIEDVISFNLQFIIQQIQDPELLDIVREQAGSEFKKNHIVVG